MSNSTLSFNNYWREAYNNAHKLLTSNEFIIKKIDEKDEMIYSKYYEVSYLTNKYNIIHVNSKGYNIKYKFKSKL